MSDLVSQNLDQDLRLKEAERWWDFYIKVGESVREYGVVTVRSLILINGGALVALLAALSNIFGKSEENAHKLASGLGCASIFLILGLILAVGTGALGYLNFMFLHRELPGPYGLHKYVKTGDVSDWKKGNGSLVTVTMVAAILCAIFSGFLFVIGSFLGLTAFKAL